MKKVTLLFSFLLCSVLMFAGKPLPNEIGQLPANAQKTIKTHFPKLEIISIILEDEAFEAKTYEVKFNTNYIIQFDSKGNWFLIDCIKDPIPPALLPTKVAQYIQKNFPGDHITQIENLKNGYEIELTSDLAITFDKNGNVKM